MGKPLKFIKMWEGANTYVFDIEPGSVMPILNTVPLVASFADKDWLYFFEKGNGAAYYEEEGIKNARISGLKDFLAPDFQKSYFKGVDDLLIICKNFVGKLGLIDIKKIPNSELGNLIEEGVDINTKLFGYYLACQPQYIAGIENRVQELLSECVEQKYIVEIFTLLSTPTKITTIRQEEIDWANLLILAKTSTEFNLQNLKEHLKKYQTLHAADGGAVWDEKYLKQKFDSDINTPIDTLNLKLVSFDNSLKKITSDQELTIKKYNLNSKIIEICKLLAEIGHMRLEMRIAGWMPVQTHLEFLAEEVAVRNSYEPKKIKFARVSEIMDIVHGKLIDKDILEKRSTNFLITILDRKTDIYGGVEAVENFKKLVENDDHSEIKEIRGNIAMKGKITGKVVVFRWTDNMNEKISQMGEGSILVAGQTRPQLMPLLVKAAGIITDEGGITSHAAIVSRELGVPCIIGTKIATQVLKDGDTVELDANTGMVRIIK